MKLLHIDSSIQGQGSVSRTLTAQIVGRELALHPDLLVVHRDLAATPLGHFNGEMFAAKGIEADARTQDQRDAVAVLDEFLASDIVVIGAPMYNFSVSSQLKSWIDRIVISGRTFRYGANGLEGLAGPKKVIAVISRGGFYGADTPMASMDFQESYLKSVFGFIGIPAIEFVRAEGISYGPEQRQKALESASQSIHAAA